MRASLLTQLMGYAGALFLVGGLLLFVWGVAKNPDSIFRSGFQHYRALLDKELRFLLLRQSSATIALSQLGFCALAALGAFVFEEWILLGLLPPIALSPLYLLRGKAQQRLRRIEEQLDPWLLMLANALKASPSLGEAISSSAKLMRPPIGEELDLVIKEMKLGTSLDQAVINMSTRIGSRAVSSSLATVLVGRQTGGDLPKILEESAATLREMARLEGVVRTKTAEGKTQAYVLGVIPFVLIAAIHIVDENWLRPLGQSSLGALILAGAVFLWMSAIVLARKILAVDV